MKKPELIRKISILLGSVLISGALILLVCWQISIGVYADRAANNASLIQQMLGEPEPAVLEERKNNEMPAFSIEGVDFVGLLTFASRDAVIPIRSTWDHRLLYMSCYSGSVYDGSIVIGATTQKGQCDFYRDINVSETLYFTDMTGKRYAYTVSDIRIRRHVDPAVLQGEEELILFIKNLYASEYTVLFCDAQN